MIITVYIVKMISNAFGIQMTDIFLDKSKAIDLAAKLEVLYSDSVLYITKEFLNDHQSHQSLDEQFHQLLKRHFKNNCRLQSAREESVSNKKSAEDFSHSAL